MLQQIIKDYRIISLLGEGGMANVYLAEHLTLRNKVAIKILKEDYVQNANIRKRFLAEARSLAQMSHPNIIKVTDLIDAGDIVAFVMEYIEGQTLEAYLSKKGGLARAEIEGFFNQMILAVEYVHEQGLIHRDIKPSNFMVSKNGQIKLLDFGIAKNTNEGAVDYTKTGLMQQMGTPLYMSPEQVKNTAEVTKQTDIYSLGVVLWQLVINKKPYDSNEISLPEIQVAILKELLPLTNTIWDSTIQQATEKDPTKRSLKISYKKIVETKSISDTEIDHGSPKQNLKKEEPKRKTYFNFKTISIAIGILLFVGILIINLIIGATADRPVTTNPDDKKPEIVLPTKDDKKSEIVLPTKDKPDLKEVKPIAIEPKHPPKEKEKTTIDPPQKEIKVQPIIETTKLKIGQKHQGGIIFYLNNTGKQGKICTERNLGPFDWDSAMGECQNLKLNGYSDWYLPSIEELKLLNNQKYVIQGLLKDFYWSSTVYNASSAYYFYFYNGHANHPTKTSTFTVRAVRAF
jgi:serine/threonine protein kinase